MCVSIFFFLNLSFESGIFNSELLFLRSQSSFSASGGSATIGTASFIYLLPHGFVFVSEFLHFCLQQRILMSLLYSLHQ